MITDPDNIELSNLSRQFLFRDNNIGQPKSIVAVKMIEKMNKNYEGKILPKLDKICSETEFIYND